MCSLDVHCTAYFSHVTFHESRTDISSNIGVSLVMALNKYKERNNGEYPQNIILYRDGVGEGQLAYVHGHEVAELKKKLPENVTLTVIVVSKRIHTQFYKPRENQMDNPISGTVIDNTVTNSEQYDFFLIPQSVRQGTVNPVSFNIIRQEITLPTDSFHKLSYMLTHLYYNWAGAVRVPAPVQYAHKLAALAGETLRSQPHDSLAEKLYYL